MVHCSLCLIACRSVPMVLLWAVIWEVAFLSALDTERWHGTVTFEVSRLLTPPTDDVRFVCWQALGLFYTLSILTFSPSVSR